MTIKSKILLVISNYIDGHQIQSLLQASSHDQISAKCHTPDTTVCQFANIVKVKTKITC